jgi:flagellar hook-associated protein 1 FlgK
MPISSFYGLQTSLRGLLAQQRSLDVTGHNIANVNTEGYSRQSADLTASPAMLVPSGAVFDGGGAQLGSGVDVLAYKRIRDSFVDVQFRAQNMRLGYQSATQTVLQDAETALAEPGDDGISAQLAAFWDAWSVVGHDAGDPAARQALVEQGSTLADAFATVDGQLKQLADAAAAEYASLTAPNGKVHAIGKELGQLNGAISNALQAGSTPNDLMDRRDLLLDQLSELGQVSLTPQDNGSVTVAFGDAATALVDGTTVTWPQALTAPNGRLGALKQLSDPDGTLDTYRKGLSGAARTLADAVNDLHASPPFFTFTDGSEAATLKVGVTASQIVTSVTTDPGANDVANKIAGLRSGAADAAYRTFVSTLGADVNAVNREQANAKALTQSVDNRRQSVAGVSLDEEMTNLVRFQRAYQASARSMSTMDEMLEQLITRTGRVGL